MSLLVARVWQRLWAPVAHSATTVNVVSSHTMHVQYARTVGPIAALATTSKSSRQAAGKKNFGPGRKAGQNRDGNSARQATGGPAVGSFLDGVIGKAKERKAKLKEREENASSASSASTSSSSQQTTSAHKGAPSSSSLFKPARPLRRRRVWSAARKAKEVRVPGIERVSNEDARKLLKKLYRYGEGVLSHTRMSEAAWNSIRNEWLRDDVKQLEEALGQPILEESKAVADKLISAKRVSHLPAHLRVASSEHGQQKAPADGDIPPAVAAILKSSVKVKASSMLNKCNVDSTSFSTSVHDGAWSTNPLSRSSFPGDPSNDNQSLAEKHFELTGDAREDIRVHTDFSEELKQFDDAAPNLKYFAELCATALARNPGLTAKQKHDYFYNLRFLVEGQFDPMDPTIQILPEDATSDTQPSTN